MLIRIMFGVLLSLLCITSFSQDAVTGKKHRDKHDKHVVPTPAPVVIPTPDPAFPEIEKKPRRPEPIQPEARPVVIYRGSWSSWLSGVFVGLVLGIVGSWLASMANVARWIGRLFGR